MAAPLSSILLFLAASILGAVGQFLYKGGADAAHGGILWYLLNLRIIFGFICYGAVMVLLSPHSSAADRSQSYIQCMPAPSFGRR